MKILLFTQHYPPDIGAQAARMKALVRAALDKGHKVTIITGEPNRYRTENKIKYEKIEKNINLDIYRIHVREHKDIFWRRSINYVSFMINSLICALKLKRGKYDVAVTTSPPITTAVTALAFAYFKRLNFVLEVRDLWPDTLVQLNVFKNKIIINFLKYVERTLYKNAKLITIVSDGFKKHIAEKGITEDKIYTFTNGIDREFILPDSDIKIKNILRKKYKIPGNKTIVSYVGNVGISQNLETVVDSVEKIENDVIFLIIGEGLEKRRLLRLVKERHLDNKILFLDALPRDKIKDIYRLSDILFLQLKDLIIFKRTIPSKIFEYLGSGLPVIYGLNGIAADILKKSGNGIKIKPECDDDLVNAINAIKDEYGLYVERAKKGREFVKKYYMRDGIMQDYIEALENLARK